MRPEKKIYMEMLEKLADAYPEGIDFVEDFDIECMDVPTRLANAVYLKEHGLARFNDTSTMDGFDVADIRITQRGLDYIAEDGGLSAELNVVVIKLHADDVKAILEREINHSSIAPEQKRKFLDQLRVLPAETIKHLAKKLVEEGAMAGLRNAPSALQWLETLFRSGGAS